MLHFQRLDIVATNGLNHATKVELKFLKTGVVGLHCIALHHVLVRLLISHWLLN